MRSERPLAVLLAVIVPAFLGIVHLLWRAGRSHPVPWSSPALAVSLFVLGLLLVPYALLSLPSVVEHLRRIVDGRPITSLVLAGAFLPPYALYWGFAGDARTAGLAGFGLYVGGTATLAALLPRGRARWAGDLAVVSVVWLPVELRWLDRSFPWPPNGAGRILCGVLALDLLLYLMLVVRRDDGVGYHFGLRAADLRTALAAFALFSLIGIPIGLGSGFLSITGRPPRLDDVAEKVALIFLFTGVPEETLFRGMLQRITARWSGRLWVGLTLASIVFGAAHLDNGPSPDWRYFLLATLAGLAYGWVYQRTGRIGPCALTHTLVDATWKTFFR
jgi:membrane protease YdiL (CAAX protease family)